MYALEALSLNKSELASLNHAWLRSIEKVFNTFDKNIVKQCQFFNGLLDITHYYALSFMSFNNKLSISPNLLVRTIATISAREDVYKLSHLFNCNSDEFSKIFKTIICEQFSSQVIQ